MFESQVNLDGLRSAVEKIRSEVSSIIVGQANLINGIITCILADGHILLEGVPGVAKTVTAKLVSATLSVDFSRIQFTPDLMPSDVLGTMIFNPKNAEFSFKKGPIFANVILVDEINRAPAKTQSALLEVMEERQVTMDGDLHKMTSPFIVLATQNPVEHEGTYRLPEAQLDRFLMKIQVPYPTLDEETGILIRFNSSEEWNPTKNIKPVITANELAEYRKLVRSVRCDEKLLRYIAQIIHQTRNSGSLSLGASPRASLGLLSAAKATSAMNGMDFVTPEHIREVVYPVLRHRIELTPEREMEGGMPDDVIKSIIEKTEIPR